jgi:hypothetical protein
MTATLLPPIEDGACGVGTPFEIARFGTAEAGVDVIAPAVVDCSLVGALDRWLMRDVQAAALHHLGQQVTGIRLAGAYVCRGRNNVADAPLSEHAFGRAIDIAAFRFEDGTWLEVEPLADEPGNEPDFLTEIRFGACGPFKTVLGPGVPDHHDHLHLDVAVRGRGGDGLYCR